MYPSSKTWHRKDGFTQQRKRPAAEDWFDDPKKRARAERQTPVTRDHLPESLQERESFGHANCAGSYASPHREYFDSQYLTKRSPKRSPPILSPPNTHNPFSATKFYNTGDYPLSPVSRSPEHISDGVDELERRSRTQCFDASIDTGETRQHSREKSSKNDRKNYGSRHPPMVDCYRPGYSPVSRRTSESMTLPPSGTSKPSTPVARKMSSRQTLQPTQQPVIVESLADFAKSITSASTLSIKYDSTTQQLSTQERRDGRRRKMASLFEFFDEERDLKAEDVTKSIDRLETQIRENSTTQTEIANNLALGMQKEQLTPLEPERSEAPSDSETTKSEVVKLRKELKVAQEEIGELRRNALRQGDLDKHIEALVSKEYLQNHIQSAQATEQKLVDIAANVSQTLKASQGVNEQHTKRLDDLNVGLVEKQRQIDDLAQETHDQRETNRLLEAFVKDDSNSNEPSLQKLIHDVSLKLSAINERMETTEDDMQQLKETVSHTHAPQRNNDLSRLWEDLKTLRQDVEALRQVPLSVGDSVISRDLELLRTSFSSLEEDQIGQFETLTSAFEELQKRVNEQTGEIKALKLSETAHFRPMPPPAAPSTIQPCRLDNSTQNKIKELENELRVLTESGKGSDERLTTALDQLIDRTDALELMSNAQQQKFDGLTTEYLLSCMIRQFHFMYPALPANVAAQVAQVLSRQSYIDQVLPGISLRINEIEKNNRAYALEIRGALNALKQDAQRSVNHDQAISTLSKQVEDLQIGYSKAFEARSTEIADILSDIAALKEQRQYWMSTRDGHKEQRPELPGHARSESSSDSDTPLGRKRKRRVSPDARPIKH